MNERVKQLRLCLNLTQEEFGNKLGVTRSAISYIESGRSNLTDHMIFTICLTFDVNKDWLRDGVGEMFVEYTMNEELLAYMGKLAGEHNPKKGKYALIFLKCLVDEWDLIEKNLDKLDKIIEWVNSKPKEREIP